MHRVRLITVQNEVVEVSDELYDFMESDRKRQAAEERSDRRHLSKSSFETVEVNPRVLFYFVLKNGGECGIMNEALIGVQIRICR